MLRTLAYLTVLGSVAFLASAEFEITDNPEAVAPAPAPTPAPAPAPAPVSRHDERSFIQQQGGNTVLQNGAGTIIRRADGRVVLQGANGQVLVANDSDESDSSEDDDSHYGSNNVIINGRQSRGSSGNVVFNSGSGGYYVNGGQSARIVNGGIELTEGGRTYNFQPRGAGVTEQEQVEINGQPAKVFYEKGGVRIERQDGTVMAYGIDGEGFFMGDRHSFENRKQILEDTQRETANLARNINEEVARSMAELQRNLQQTLGNIHLNF